MKLENQTVSELLGKNKQKTQEAAKKIINTPDIDAWKCLLENSDYVFSYIKHKAGKALANEITKENTDKVIELFKFHEGDWDEYLAEGLSRNADENLNEKMLTILEKGALEEKIYATRYFCLVNYPKAIDTLFNISKSFYQELKSNAAEALGILNHEESYNYYINQLNSDDEWERIEAAQFLAKFGKKEAAVPILESMENSGMAELIAGEIATLIDIYELFDEENEKTQSLALEALDNILSGIPEIWPLCVILDFKIFECLEKLIYLTKSPGHTNNLIGRYAQILLKSKQKFGLFINNTQYTYDEEHDILAELDEIYHLLLFENEEFWKTQFQRLLKELESADIKRKLAAIAVLNELEAEESAPYLIKTALKQGEDEVVICEVITTLSKMGQAGEIDRDLLLSRIKDPNLLAVVNNSLRNG
ncbi:MAG TPA: hypothetical protein P5556_01925 [Candidatus Gastranaerophilales bacterium]|nr:hypothetical protein [Candidatus Gastranaerophilales bacterium]